MWVGETKSGIGGERLLGQKAKAQHSKIPQGQGNAAPAWVAFDRQVKYSIRPIFFSDNFSGRNNILSF